MNAITDPDHGLAETRLISFLDPVAQLLQGGFPYGSAPAALPDEQSIPSLRVRRLVDAPGLRVAIEHYRDRQRTDRQELAVERLPLDRELARPRRRTHPAAARALRLRLGAEASREDGLITLALPGPGPQDVREVVEAAAGHRLVIVEPTGSADPVLMSFLLLQLAAGGTACWVPPERAAALELLSPELRTSLTFDVDEAMTDDLVLAARAAIQKRAAWAGHDLRLMWDADPDRGWEPRLRPVPWPAVSVVLVSRRPDLVPTALAMIAAQEHVEVEVVVAIHGDGDGVRADGRVIRGDGDGAVIHGDGEVIHGDGEVIHGDGEVDALREQLDGAGLTGQVIRVPAQVPFGSVFNHAVRLSSAPVILKWDDDDLYGPRHIEDLLVARRQTGAALIGKAAEFVYFDEAGQTIWRNPGRAEAPSIGQAGGTFLLDRALFDEIGGFPDVTRAIDHHLKVRLRERGTMPFRTHGFGFVLRRHARGHTWDATDEQLRARAVRTFDGLPEILQLGDATRFSELPEA